MKRQPLRITVLGLSITSSWGNGHATTYRALIGELYKAGHEVLFLERDMPWYAAHRDSPSPDCCETRLYHSVEELKSYEEQVQESDLVIVGSYVPEGIAVGEWAIKTANGLVAFYDIDTPVTLKNLEQDNCEYLNRHLVSGYDLYLSFTGGPTLRFLEEEYASPAARALYCSVDSSEYFPVDELVQWDLGYLGTYSEDRQPSLEKLLLEPAAMWEKGRFVVAGPMYPQTVRWPENVQRYEHLEPEKHRMFYNAQRFTLNLTRHDMIQRGYSPSVRLFEAAACGTTIISDYWDGIEEIFEPGTDILISKSAEQTLHYLTKTGDDERKAMGMNARDKVLGNHTASHRAEELIRYMDEIRVPRHES